MSSHPFNGYPSWNAWNVSLWLTSDERLYKKLTSSVSIAKPRGIEAGVEALSNMLLPSKGTPDGAKYSKRSLKIAIEHELEG